MQALLPRPTGLEGTVLGLHISEDAIKNETGTDGAKGLGIAPSLRLDFAHVWKLVLEGEVLRHPDPAFWGHRQGTGTSGLPDLEGEWLGQ